MATTHSSSPATAPVVIGGEPLSVADVVMIARSGAEVVLDTDALGRVDAARAIIDQQAASPDPHYGVSTGFGALATTSATLSGAPPITTGALAGEDA